MTSFADLFVCWIVASSWLSCRILLFSLLVRVCVVGGGACVRACVCVGVGGRAFVCVCVCVCLSVCLSVCLCLLCLSSYMCVCLSA